MLTPQGWRSSSVLKQMRKSNRFPRRHVTAIMSDCSQSLAARNSLSILSGDRNCWVAGSSSGAGIVTCS
jgi:hypothetical protein